MLSGRLARVAEVRGRGKMTYEQKRNSLSNVDLFSSSQIVLPKSFLWDWALIRLVMCTEGRAEWTVYSNNLFDQCRPPFCSWIIFRQVFSPTFVQYSTLLSKCFVWMSFWVFFLSFFGRLWLYKAHFYSGLKKSECSFLVCFRLRGK